MRPRSRLERGRLLRGCVLRGDLVRRCGEQDRQEDRCAQRAADLAEEDAGRACYPDVARRHRVLHGELDGLHVQAEADAEQRHVDVGAPQGRVGADGGQQEHRDDQRGTAGDRELLVLAGTRGDLTGDHRRRHDAEDQRQDQQAGLRGRGTLHDLQVQRDGRDAAEHADADDERLRGADRERSGPEQSQRDQRLVAHPPLDHHESREAGQADEVAQPRPARGPAPGPSLLGDDQQRHQADDQRGGALPVDAVVAALMRDAQDPVHDHERDQPDRHVHVEDPAPATNAEDRVLPRQEPADNRPEHAGRREHGHEVAHVAGTVLWRHDVGEDRECEGEQPAGAESLERAERGEHVHRRREPAQRRAEDEHRDCDEEQRLAAVDVRQLAVERRGDRRGDEECRRDPRLDAQAVQIVADAPDRGRDDRLVEGGEKHAEQQPGKDRQNLTMGQRALAGGLIRSRGGHQLSSRFARSFSAKNCGRCFS